MMTLAFVNGENNQSPNFAKAKIAAERVLALLERKPVVDNLSEGGKKPEVRN